MVTSLRTMQNLYRQSKRLYSWDTDTPLRCWPSNTDPAMLAGDLLPRASRSTAKELLDAQAGDVPAHASLALATGGRLIALPQRLGRSPLLDLTAAELGLRVLTATDSAARRERLLQAGVFTATSKEKPIFSLAGYLRVFSNVC